MGLLYLTLISSNNLELKPAKQIYGLKMNLFRLRNFMFISCCFTVHRAEICRLFVFVKKIANYAPELLMVYWLYAFILARFQAWTCPVSLEKCLKFQSTLVRVCYTQKLTRLHLAELWFQIIFACYRRSFEFIQKTYYWRWMEPIYKHDLCFLCWSRVWKCTWSHHVQDLSAKSLFFAENDQKKKCFKR